ncbi:iron complex transport system substrate-binding protein [Faunimonas pinastri]|uniref:Iron complex transport system substrate-binding protein n=1 Tax=Faunimonas pinastri TaxID=1855383 RepID=A0A1H9M1F1_9HYPH|nr:ABC transporter substrate-binding protein [Faunimonas pinastri]SER16893.1 iron complex transport system substrate-binding protein [Faunimonas pinastri]
MRPSAKESVRLVALTVLWIGAALPVRAETAHIVRDAAGRQVTVDDLSRIVSVGGATTEILYALGLRDRIAAVDTTSLFPPQALKDKPNVGYMRQLSPEGVLSLRPSLILAEEGSGPAPTIAFLEKASVPFVLVPSEQDAAGVAKKIRFIADVAGESAKGETFAKTVEADLDRVEKAVAEVPSRARVLFVLSQRGGRVMAAGQGTAADAMLKLAGAENAIHGYDGYRQLSTEALLAAAPDAIVVMGNGGDGLNAESIKSDAALAATPAVRNDRIVVMDGLYLLGFGPRIAFAVRDLAAALYPDLALPELEARPWMSAGR